jgi:hypothetical protein
VELVHGRPAVHADGSLEFPGPTPTLTGYRREGRRLHPDWPPCSLRMLRVQVLDGVLSIAGLCGTPGAERFSREVTLNQCRSCPVRRF